MTVLILTEQGDLTADVVTRKLQERGAATFTFDPGGLPASGRLTYEGGGGGPSRRLLCTKGGELDLDQVSAIWWRRPRPVGADDPRSSQRHFRNMETHAAWMGLLSSLEARWLPGRPHAQERADLKVEQLVRAERLGFTIPHTLYTNSPRDFADFYDREEGQVIAKISEPNAFALSHPPLQRYTARVVRQDLAFLHECRAVRPCFNPWSPRRWSCG